jgi:hypothetical protein
MGRISRQYQVDWTRLHAGRRSELHPADGGLCATYLGKCAVHPQRCPGGPAAMVLAIEQQQQRVTAPLEKVTALALGIDQQLAENSVKEVAQFLGAFSASASQPLSEWGKAGDVELQQAAVDHAVGGS